MNERQAEILAEEQTKLIDERLVSKKDIEELRITTQRDLQALEYRMIIKLGTLMTIMSGLVVTLIKLI